MTSTRDATLHHEMRHSTIMKVINAVQNNITRKREIQESTGLSWGSCSELINLLYDMEILVSVKPQKTGKKIKQGRRPVHFSFNNHKYLLCGIHINSEMIDCSVANFGKEEIYYESYPLKEEISNKNIFKQITSTYYRFLDDVSLDPAQVIGLSVSLIGGVDVESMKWIFSPRHPKISNVDFSKIYDHIPSVNFIFLEHDIRAQASSVLKANNWQDNNYVFLHLGEGIGITIYDGKLFSGYRGFAGEVGHIPYPSKDSKKRKCRCGKLNCLETVLSKRAILKYVKQQYKQSANAVYKLDPSILKDAELQSHIIDPLVFLLVMVINILDPRSVIIGGEAIEPFQNNIAGTVSKRVSKEAWLGGAEEIRWYSSKDVNCAYGAILNLSDKMINRYIYESVV